MKEKYESAAAVARKGDSSKLELMVERQTLLGVQQVCAHRVWMKLLSVPNSQTRTVSSGEGGSWFRPQHAGSKPRGTRGAIPLSSSFKGGDPK